MKKYWPLVVVILVSALGGFVLIHANLEHSFMGFMVNFSGLFFLFLATLKFWDLKGFSQGFQKYDFLAQRSVAYSFIYPFLELLIALGFLAHFFLVGVAIFTALLMLFGMAGVIAALMRGEDLRCACMGTKLDLPLTTVTIVENLGMGTMAVFIAIYRF